MNVVLHICCALCAAGAAERLMQEGRQVLGFFYNPNIYPQEEYLLRLANTRKVAEGLGFRLIEGFYEPEEWLKMIAGLESEPEGGKRCQVCFRMRLAKAYQVMLENCFDAFTTTLTMGSNKPAALIGRIGHEIGGAKYLDCDFKKRDGFTRSGELAREWGLYRQHYCGCRYSMR
jgi:predicted adenine nucleotide alpha hydrolase (AANH) superfamily ATPase